MKRILTIILGCTCALTALAQDSEILDTVLVSASRHKQSLQSSNRNVIVISGDQLKKAPTQSIHDLLDFAVGIDARQRGTLGLQTDLSIRGSSFEQVLVLLNGTRLSDPQTGHHLMNLPVSKNDIEKIEILLGGGSYIFGGSAFSGAVNIITKDPSEDRFNLQGAYGSHNSYDLNVSQQFNGADHSILISANTTASDGFKENTDFNRNNLFLQGHFDMGEHELRLRSGYTWQNFGAQNFYSDNFPEQYEETKTLFASLGMISPGKVTLKREIYWRRNWDEFQLYREGDGFYRYNNGLFIKGEDTAATWYQGHNYHRSDVLGGKIEADTESKWGKTSVAAEYRYERIQSNNLGQALEASIPIQGSRGSYDLGDQRYNISLAAEQSKKLGDLHLTAALLANYNTAYEVDLYPAFTAGYNLSKQHKIYSSFNRSFRLPSYTDLYYRLGGAVGSKDLQPEKSLNYELGYKWLGKYHYLNVSLWRREGNNIIDWIQRCPSCDLVASNTSEVNFNGLDFNLKLSGMKGFDRLALQSINLGYSHIFSDTDELPYESLYVFDYLKNKLTLEVSHEIIADLSLSYSLSYQDRNGSYRDAATGTSLDYEDVLLLNARLAYQWGKLELYSTAQNLLNKTYFDRGNIELPGLWVWSGLSLSL